MIKIYDECQSLRTITIERVSDDENDFEFLKKMIEDIKGKHRLNPLTLIILEKIDIHNVL
jgi:hypothetical protein